MGVEIIRENKITLVITNDNIDTLISNFDKLAERKPGFGSIDMTDEEQQFVKALNDYFKEELEG